MSDFAGAARKAAAIAGRLGWAPEDFWAATPADLLNALAPAAAEDAALGTAELRQMMEREHG